MTGGRRSRDKGNRAMPADIIRFPQRRRTAVFIVVDDDGWLVLAGSHGWLHGDYDAALTDARWLARNLALSIRSAAA
jgi:hypothetical protein